MLGTLLLFSTLWVSPPGHAGETADFVIGYLEQSGDPRYSGSTTAARYLTGALGRPYAGAETALKEVTFHGAGAGVRFQLQRERAGDSQALLAALRRLQDEGVSLFLLDLPTDSMAMIAAATRELPLLLFNISAADDRLRAEQCQPQLLHVPPSDAMQADALVQFLVFRKWREALVLEGPAVGDKVLAEAFRRAAKRYGVKITDTRGFVLSNDPREREQNNPALLTRGDYDVVFVADQQGEFARALPYSTLEPRPVVGSEGLAGVAWHWAWERHGAPQLEKRFRDVAGRAMRGGDWGAWMAIKAIAEAVQRTGSADFDTLREHLLSPELVLDGFKGNRLSFRPWDLQLRQPVLLATHNWVVERAPLSGFLHATNNLDTLGMDERESACRF
jgi:ABC transporter substrate binding protein (PQQ-dependent alcohol dehydrogenase system)